MAPTGASTKLGTPRAGRNPLLKSIHCAGTFVPSCIETIVPSGFTIQ
jgi:hypothetical protein